MKELIEQIHENAVDKGWWEDPRSPLEIHMLIVSEISEATEAARKDLPPVYYDLPLQDGSIVPQIIAPEDLNGSVKPEGELIELADAVIRIMDYCGHKGWDLETAILKKHEYNLTRPHRHGNKKY